MKTPAYLAMQALTQSIAADLVTATAIAEESRQEAERGNLISINGAIVGLVHLREKIDAVLAQIDAVQALHKSGLR